MVKGLLFTIGHHTHLSQVTKSVGGEERGSDQETFPNLSFHANDTLGVQRFYLRDISDNLMYTNLNHVRLT